MPMVSVRKIRSYISCAIPFLSEVSDLILRLPHCHRHIAIYVAQIVDTILGRMCLVRDLYFTLLVSQQFDKHLYLASYLNAYNQYILAPKTGCTAKDGITHYY